MQINNLASLSVGKREALIDAEVASVGNFLRSTEGKRILESGTTEEIWKMLIMMPPLIREHIRGTKYDIATGEWPSVRLSRSLVGASQTHKLGDRFPMQSYGNGFYTGRGTLTTNWHVLGGLVGNLRSRNRFNQLSDTHGLDIVHVEFPENHIEAHGPQKILSYMGRDEDVHGTLITVAGIDPDSTAGKDGTKLYPSLAVRMTPRLVDFFAPTRIGSARNEMIRAELGNSFMFILPPGENESRDDMSMPIHGMSGSPVISAGTVAGILQAGMNGRTVNKQLGLEINIGFFHGPDAIKKAKDIGLTYKASEWR